MLFRSQLQQASIITKKYASIAQNDAHANDIENFSLPDLAKDLLSLAKLGFEAESLSIEKKAMSLMSEGQKKIFKAEIVKVLVPNDAAVNLATAKTADSN